MTTDNSKQELNNQLKRVSEIKYNGKHKRMIRTELDDGTIIVGKNKYDALSKIPSNERTDNQKKQVKDFEDYHGITDYLKKLDQAKTITEKKILIADQKKKQIIASINFNTVKDTFKKVYQQINGHPFKATKTTIENITPLLYYFAKDEAFLNYGVKDSMGRFLSVPDMSKGICIVGGFGNGKTSIMNTFQRMFLGLEGYSFGRFSSHEIIRLYEDASKQKTPEILDNLWKILTRSELYIDDVKAEPQALTYGKKNVLNALFQERYNKKLKTHISINYAPGANHDVKEALLELKTKYSNQVYDRVFEMYNIIEFKGKSFRR